MLGVKKKSIDNASKSVSNTVVSDSTQNNGTKIAPSSDSLGRSPLKPNRKLIIIFGCILLLVVAGYFVVTKSNKQTETTKRKSAEVCTAKSPDDVASQAAQNLNPKDYKKLQPVVEKIKKMTNYEADPNCLYPVIMYYVYVSDFKNANENYKKLEEVYDPDVGFITIFKSRGATLETVKAQVDNIEKLNKQLQSNRVFFDQ